MWWHGCKSTNEWWQMLFARSLHTSSQITEYLQTWHKAFMVVNLRRNVRGTQMQHMRPQPCNCQHSQASCHKIVDARNNRQFSWTCMQKDDGWNQNGCWMCLLVTPIYDMPAFRVYGRFLAPTRCLSEVFLDGHLTLRHLSPTPGLVDAASAYNLRGGITPVYSPCLHTLELRPLTNV